MNPRCILGLQLKRLGDIILTTPAMQMLSDAFPEASVELMVDPKLANFGKHVSACKVIAAPHKLTDYLKLAQSKYDIVLDFTGQDRCAVLAALTGAKQKITFRKYFKKLGRPLCFTKAVKSSLRENHVADHLADLPRELGLTGKSGRPALKTSTDDWNRALAKLHAAGLKETTKPRYFLLHPGTARSEKFWSPEGWGKVIDFVSERTDLPVVISASSDPNEKAHFDAVARSTSSPTIRMAGNLTLSEFITLIEHADVMACVDSAPVHIADAFNTPTFALFGPTDARIWGPRFARNHCIQAPLDAPESTSMSLIAAKDVLTALDDFLASLARSPIDC